MSENSNGLRFDVYERIHLPDDAAGIHELEEIELVPRIQVLDQGEQAVLKGQLLLTGVYRGQNAGDAPLSLEHWIPVEITLPMNRVTRLDDISIEIDNFDVDLLSARTLNITGVLSLQGITVEPVEEGEGAWRSEPFTAVHQREHRTELPAEEFTRLPEPSGQSYIPETVQFAEAETEADASHPEAESVQSAFEYGFADSQTAESLQRDDEAQPAPFVYSSPAEQLFQYSEPDVAQQQIEAIGESVRPASADVQADVASSSLAEEPLREPAAMEEDSLIESEPLNQSEPQPLRVAFQSKESRPAEEQSSIGFVSLLQSSKREQAARQAAEQIAVVEKAEERAKAAEQSSGDDIEWKRLFLTKGADEHEFRKIKMCIVQKDETLDLIALRYSKNVKEIAIHNRLSDSVVTEGQLIYIP